MDSNSEPIFSLDLGTNGQFTFFSEAELRDWINSQRELYKPLYQRRRENAVPSVVADKIENIFASIDNASHIPSNAKPEQIKSIYSTCRATILQHFAEGQLPTVQSPKGNLLSSLPPAREAYALAFFMGLNVPLSTNVRDGLRGLFQALFYDLGVSPSPEPAAKALNNIYGEWSAKLAESKQTEAQLKADHESEISAQRTATAEHITQLAATLTDTSNQLTQKLGDIESQLSKKLLDAEDRLKAVEKTYDEKLALKSAVTYWETKAVSHKKWAVVWGLSAIFAAVVATQFVFHSVQNTLSTTRLVDAQLWQVTQLALFAVFGVWIMRVLIRLMLSNTHLHTDATERRTMMLTYLAMIRERQLPEGESRDLILQALFRPTSTGIIKDDASPPFMAEWLKCTVGKE